MTRTMTGKLKGDWSTKNNVDKESRDIYSFHCTYAERTPAYENIIHYNLVKKINSLILSVKT